MRGVTIVVSPLISLMQDQVAALHARNIAAAYLASTQRRQIQQHVWRATRTGQLKLLYISPERLRSATDELRGMPISLVAVDEAHCISEWGHQFRPPYRAIGRTLELLGRPPTMALTATASPATRTDIARVLRLRRPVTIVQSFDRPNLRFWVRRFASNLERITEVSRLLEALRGGAAIIYVPTRNRADGVAALLRRWDLPVVPYHAGLPSRARRSILARFRDGRLRFVVATSAFGMGIDRPDVRLVVHLGIPLRPESYYQEAGRAGRDGQLAQCALFWLEGDLRLAGRLARRAIASGGMGSEGAGRGLETMRAYLTAARCRRRLLLSYLGEQGVRCHGCDWCNSTQGLLRRLRRGPRTGKT